MISSRFLINSLNIGKNLVYQNVNKFVPNTLISHVNKNCKVLPNIAIQYRNINTLTNVNESLSPWIKSLVSAGNKQALCNPNVSSCSLVPCRTVIKLSMFKGKRVTDKEVIKRFKRLPWGIWIRPRSGATKKLWRKSTSRKNRSQQNFFCNATQSRRLDKMVTRYWRKPRVYADDPYEPYMYRENYWRTSLKPWQH